MTYVQKTYDALNGIANTEPFKFIREWNKGLEVASIEAGNEVLVINI